MYGMVRFDEPDNRNTFRVETLNPNTGTGRIVLVGPLDYETKPMYQLRILAIDATPTLSRQNTATLAVVVQVLDSQDTPPHFVLYPSVTFVPENVPIGKEVFNVLAQDGDRGKPNQVDYSLEPTNSPFAIDQQTGVVYVAQALDREASYLKSTGGAIVLTVIATEVPNSPGSSAAVQVTVIIEVSDTVTVSAYFFWFDISVHAQFVFQDSNDNAPRFYDGENSVDNYFGSIAENSPVGALVSMSLGVVPRVYDPDQGINGSFALSILGTAANIFDITPVAVVNEAVFMLRVRNSSYLDYEVIKQYQFVIMAQETATLEHFSGTATVTVNVTDINDSSPVFSPDVYEVHMKENTEPGTHVLRVQAYDSDSGDFGAVLYTGLQGKYAEYFKLDAYTGDITVLRVNLQYEIDEIISFKKIQI